MMPYKLVISLNKANLEVSKRNYELILSNYLVSNGITHPTYTLYTLITSSFMQSLLTKYTLCNISFS